MNNHNTSVLVPNILKSKLDASVKEGQTTIHCTVQTPASLSIWQNIRLRTSNGKYYKLTDVFKVSLYPKWIHIGTIGTYQFTLIFEPLDNAVTQFDMIENNPELGGVKMYRIKRNQRDVYNLKLS